MAASLYLDRLSLLLGGDAYGLLFSEYARKPEISVAEDYGKPCIYPLYRTSAPAIDSGVIFVQNIDLDMISAFGTHYDIEPLFFAHHALRVREYRSDMSSEERFSFLSRVATRFAADDGLSSCRNCWHVESELLGRFRAVCFGVQSFHSILRHPVMHASSEASRISFCKLKPDLFLVLVDDPINFSFLWCDLDGLNRDLPPPSQDSILALSDLIIGYFTGEWSRRLLTSIDSVLHSEGCSPGSRPNGDIETALGALCWLLSIASLNPTLGHVSAWVNRLDCDAIERPGMDLLSELGSCRRIIHQLKVDMEARERVTPLSVKTWALRIHEKSAQDLQPNESHLTATWSKSWVDQWTSINGRVERLSASLNDSFQMLIGAMTVLDSAANKKQAERATMLTLLAAIYLPLTLTTGIFGMNLREVNQGSPPWWWVMIVMVVLLTPSIIFMVYLFTKNRLETFRERRAKSESDKMV
ncbi:uncharacterized protein RHO25_005781 [Cercospora beticola]|uniref:Magnesium transport protein CorA n=2 Tax=Cercospora beticola TaxID=122368 RepID=A0ABZ0NNS1_CERBT|nr:hypothetical protein RHO25_005781 [Cercospora beticola]